MQLLQVVASRGEDLMHALPAPRESPDRQQRLVDRTRDRTRSPHAQAKGGGGSSGVKSRSDRAASEDLLRYGHAMFRPWRSRGLQAHEDEKVEDKMLSRVGSVWFTIGLHGLDG